jgi:hypothetical protein
MSDLPLLVFDSARVGVEPGGEAVLGLRVRNQATVVDELEIQLLGPAAEWAAAEPPTLSLFPGTDGTALIRFRPPRTSKLAPGAVPVGVRVVSKVDPVRTVVDECRVDVGSFREVTAELWPRSSRGLRKARHEVRLRNEGNVPAGVSLEPAELDGSCRVTVQPGRVVVAPGQAASSRVTVRPSRTLWFGGVETYSFAVKAAPERSEAVKVAGSMRQGPLVPGTAVTLALVAVIAIAAAAVLLGHGAIPLGIVTASTPTPSTEAALPLGPSVPAPSPSPSASASPSPSPSPSVAASPSVSPSAHGLAAPLPWPSPGDCVAYDPNALTLTHIAFRTLNYWLVRSGSLSLQFDVGGDATDALALARRYAQLCTLGRTNTRTDHFSYVMYYWLGPTGATTTIATRDCVAYSSTDITIVNLGVAGWEVVSGGNGLQLFDTQADAENGVLALRHAGNLCVIGRNEPTTAPNHTSLFTTYLS